MRPINQPHYFKIKTTFSQNNLLSTLLFMLLFIMRLKLINGILYEPTDE